MKIFLTNFPFPQPYLVNDQLEQLYLDLELEELSTKLCLGDSSESDDEATLNFGKKRLQYNQMAVLFEESCPFPKY